ncbi:hypothetical protein ATO6_07465 [Oceanicola sp. 22II-s10i]|uniref:hypothetical protein n=1 Tax=Oceanicola sp. 22II-s10i TaxID=1317116 RepID=UPI000B5242F5|nr:hypothetical protein [Oceanicola sp. 22II-s10i]OWU86610.1 hypothetical protein ATO6_07465 [Oceanicola sp. 22II-s10i]
MSRLILVIVLLAALVAAASLIASAWSKPSASSGTLPARRSSAIQKVAYVLLIVIMTGVATGWVGAE